MNDRTRLLIIGGDAAGMSAASQARRLRGADDLEIVALERGEYASYSACGLPYYVSGEVAHADDLVARTPEEFAERDIELRMGTEAVGIDLKRGAVATVGADGRQGEERFDRLVIGTGAVPIRPDLPGSDAEGVFGIQTLPDGVALRRYLADHPPRRAVVVGGGYIGLEMAEALLRRGAEVALVEAAAEPMGTLDPDMGRRVREAVCGMGAEFFPNAPVTGFETGDDGRVRAVLTENARHEADVVVLGLGVRPNVDLARGAGLDIGPSGGIATDARMRTSAEGVWAAGDCVESFHRVSRAPVSIALGTHANKQGRVAGTDIGGGYARFAGVLGTAITKICGLEVARTGLNEREAEQAGFAFETVTVESSTRAGYYPGAKTMATKMIAELGTGRLLGGQIVGAENAGKRIDVIATALWNAMPVGEIASMDLSYAPPFAPVWDPVLITARKLADKVR
ncbi:NADPH-dependent 2,4-dienoyl-CoA reductase/sulfur reductase-like enzyme [Murinocardiopsis flavida]|uniref:NADPH-dependent 2,4-dienoyl-CoA reductase/sulfur reductase-like enzyme n=1 Tax=Murinocardiopsis flavida TaxID=645275 RepID=A0A2P8DQE1_9ACTN|nr:FAD-dependent oxidoreductase [Murinocardiopsis flavida]PSK99445.1 NADPH-dependent 2,4-dienoyl-CoA reductase/sulfur reductase-like enzyme [Murinocardiopsis flavida]